MPAPLIILCPLRSFSSVVCAMLGQHPQMYGMPELNLFLTERLWGLVRMTETRMPHGRDGLLRALAQLHAGEQSARAVEAAGDWISERLAWPTRRVFDHLMRSVAPRRLIDKSPSTVMRWDYLERTRGIHEEVRFLHLTRHPVSYGRSLSRFIERSGQWGREIDAGRVDPERVWLRAHHRILRFTQQLPDGCSMRVRGEDILAHPDSILAGIVEWLGLDTDPHSIDEMKHPERSPFACTGPANAEGGGDPDFLADPVLSDARRPAGYGDRLHGAELDWSRNDSLSAETVRLAQDFGYH